MAPILKKSLQFAATIAIPFSYLYLLLLMVATKNTTSYPLFIIYLGILLAVSGIILWIVSMVDLRHAFGVLPQKQKRVKTGVYKHLKHPMYIGMMLAYIGLSLTLQTLPGLVLTLCFLLPLLIVRAYYEEKALR